MLVCVIALKRLSSSAGHHEGSENPNTDAKNMFIVNYIQFIIRDH